MFRYGAKLELLNQCVQHVKTTLNVDYVIMKCNGIISGKHEYKTIVKPVDADPHHWLFILR